MTYCRVLGYFAYLSNIANIALDRRVVVPLYDESVT